MTATNHALTGAAIGLLVGEPLIALPAALLSHFICDALPHFGSSLPPEKYLKTKNFMRYLITDASLCVLLVAALAAFRPEHWLLASVCAFLATSPDLLWINKLIEVKRGKHWKRGLFAEFADRIQWFAKPIGAVVEAAWFIAGVIVIATIIHP